MIQLKDMRSEAGVKQSAQIEGSDRQRCSFVHAKRDLTLPWRYQGYIAVPARSSKITRSPYQAQIKYCVFAGPSPESFQGFRGEV
jgi:hypothetical protein